jgi:hypothetical protein
MTPAHSQQLWNPCSLLSNDYWSLFLGQSIKLNTQLELVSAKKGSGGGGEGRRRGGGGEGRRRRKKKIKFSLSMP